MSGRALVIGGSFECGSSVGEDAVEVAPRADGSVAGSACHIGVAHHNLVPMTVIMTLRATSLGGLGC